MPTSTNLAQVAASNVEVPAEVYSTVEALTHELLALTNGSSAQVVHRGSAVGTVQHNATQPGAPPLVVGGVNVSLGSAATSLASSATMIAIVIPNAHAAADLSTIEQTASVASPLVNLAMHETGAESAAEQVTKAVPAASITVEIDIPLDAVIDARDNISCANAPEGFWAHDARHANETCVAGCCRSDGGTCGCRMGFVGARCDFELRCAIIPTGGQTFQGGFEHGGGGDDASAGASCSTLHQVDPSRLRCSCRKLGLVAVLRYRMLPATNSLGLGWLHTLAPRVLGRWGALLTIWLGLLGLALYADARLLYLDVASPRLPFWLRPLTDSEKAFRIDLLATILTRSSLLRLVFVYRGFTVYSHAQLLHVLLFAVATNTLCIALFLGSDEQMCSMTAVLLAALSTAFASLVASGTRLLFRWANFANGSQAKRRYRAHKDARLVARHEALALNKQRRAMRLAARRAHRADALGSGKAAPGRSGREGSGNADGSEGSGPRCGNVYEASELSGVAAGMPPLSSKAQPTDQLLQPSPNRRPVFGRWQPQRRTRVHVSSGAPSLGLGRLMSSGTDLSGDEAEAKRGGGRLLLGSAAQRRLVKSRMVSAGGLDNRDSSPEEVPLDLGFTPPPSPPSSPSPSPSPPPPLASQSASQPSWHCFSSRTGSAHSSSCCQTPGDAPHGLRHELSASDTALTLRALTVSTAELGEEPVSLSSKLSAEASGRAKANGGVCAMAAGGSEPPHYSTARTAFLARQALRRQLATYHVYLEWDQVVLCNDGHSVGFELKTAPKTGGVGLGDGATATAGSACARYVPALHVSLAGPALVRTLRVGFDGSELPPGLIPRGPELRRSQVARASSRSTMGSTAFLHPTHCRWQCLLAWAVNGGLFVGATFWLLFVLASRELVQPSQLHAGALDDGEWYAQLRVSFGMQLFYSLVVVDGVKIACLTLTSGPMLEGFMPPKATWPIAHGMIRRPLRRMHKVLDVLL